jgi:hypothetical protein
MKKISTKNIVLLIVNIGLMVIIIFVLVSFFFFNGKTTKSSPVAVNLPAKTYSDGLIYERSPIKAIPLGYYSVMVTENTKDDAGSVYVGTDPKIISKGTHLFIIGMGFRIATSDSRVQGESILIYGDTDVEEYFIWALSQYHVYKDTPDYKFGL